MHVTRKEDLPKKTVATVFLSTLWHAYSLPFHDTCLPFSLHYHLLSPLQRTRSYCHPRAIYVHWALLPPMCHGVSTITAGAAPCCPPAAPCTPAALRAAAAARKGSAHHLCLPPAAPPLCHLLVGRPPAGSPARAAASSAFWGPDRIGGLRKRGRMHFARRACHVKE